MRRAVPFGSTLVLLFLVQAGCGSDVEPAAVAAVGGDCPSMDEFLEQNPDATPEEMYEVETCIRERARAAGRSGRNAGFLGNSYDRPKGALAHFEGHSTGSSFTVFDDHIHTTEDFGSTETKVYFESVTAVEEGWQTPGSLRIEYTSDEGHTKHISFMLFGPDDLEKEEGARDVDRLRDLLERQRSEHETRRS